MLNIYIYDNINHNLKNKAMPAVQSRVTNTEKFTPQDTLCWGTYERIVISHCQTENRVYLDFMYCLLIDLYNILNTCSMRVHSVKAYLKNNIKKKYLLKNII